MSTNESCRDVLQHLSTVNPNALRENPPEPYATVLNDLAERHLATKTDDGWAIPNQDALDIPEHADYETFLSLYPCDSIDTHPATPYEPEPKTAPAANPVRETLRKILEYENTHHSGLELFEQGRLTTTAIGMGADSNAYSRINITSAELDTLERELRAISNELTDDNLKQSLQETADRLEIWLHYADLLPEPNTTPSEDSAVGSTSP